MTKILTKLTLTSFNPKQSAGFPGGNNEMFLGRLIGAATGVKEALLADQVTKTYGVKGSFAATYIDRTDKDGVVHEREDEQAGSLFLPESYMDPILSLFEDTYKTDEAGNILKDDKGNDIIERKGARGVDIAYDVFVVKADNPAGYSWSLRPLLAPSQSDPLAAIMARIPAFTKTGELPAPETKPALEAPKGKGK